MNCWLPRGKKIKVEQLVGDPEKPVFLGAEEFRDHMRERIAAAKLKEEATAARKQKR
jgi:hypothetical protein